MATSTHFGWAEPDDTDLVKNGAAAIRTLGNAIDTSLYNFNGRNPILNSNFSVWQRGTSTTDLNGSGRFIADRWQIYSGASGRTVSRQVTNDTTNLPNIQYCLRFQRDSGNTATNQLNMAQNFETVNAIPFAGKQVTLSFYARAGANYSAASNALNVKIQTGTGTDQNGFYSGYTGSASPIDSNVTLTTTWQRFSVTGTIATTATEFLVGFYFTPAGTAGAADYYEITGVQLDLGSVALPYKTNASTIQGELAACQRYYSKSARTATTPADGNGYSTDCVYQMNTTNSTTTLITSFFGFPVNMRVAPTMTYYRSDLSATAGKWGYYSGSWVAATVTNAVLTDKGFGVSLAGTYTANNAYTIAGGWAADAEL